MRREFSGTKTGLTTGEEKWNSCTKQTWAEYDRKLDTSIRLNRQLLLAVNITGCDGPCGVTLGLGLGALIGLIGPAILGQLFTTGRTASCAACRGAGYLGIAMWLRRFGRWRWRYGSITTSHLPPSRNQIESLRVLRVRIVQWAVLTGRWFGGYRC